MSAIRARPFLVLCVLTALNAGYVLWPGGLSGEPVLRLIFFVGIEDLLVLLVASFCVEGEPANGFQRFLKRRNDLFQSMHHGRLHRPTDLVMRVVFGLPFLVLLAFGVGWAIWS